MRKLLLPSCLVAGLDLRTDAGEDALDVRRVGAVGSQFQILLVSLDASRRSDDLLRLRIDRRLRNQRLALDVIGVGPVRVGSDRLVGCGSRLVELAGVVE